MKRCQESIHCGTNSNSTEARGRASVEWALTGQISSPEFVIQWIGPIFKSLACPICAVGGDGLEKRHTIFEYVTICIGQLNNDNNIEQYPWSCHSNVTCSSSIKGSAESFQLRGADEWFCDGQRRYFLVASLSRAFHPSLWSRASRRYAYVRPQGANQQLGNQSKSTSGLPRVQEWFSMKYCFVNAAIKVNY